MKKKKSNLIVVIIVTILIFTIVGGIVAYLTDSDSKTTLSNNIQAIIKCYICLEKIKNPCMCPKCQKLTCEECIEKWLLEKKNQCPHCRVTLNFNQLIHLSFMTDVANYIDRISTNKKVEQTEICPKHEIQNFGTVGGTFTFTIQGCDKLKSFSDTYLWVRGE